MAFFFLLSVIIAGVALAAVGLRFRHLRPASVAYADSRSAELWHELKRRRLLLVFTDSLPRSAKQHLSDPRETLQAGAPSVFKHFGCDKRAAVPTVCGCEAGYRYLMEVAYKDKLARVLLAVLAGLRPLCAISIGRERPVHPILLWPPLFLRLDGPPWFVLCFLMTRKRQMQLLYDGRELVEAWRGEYART